MARDSWLVIRGSWFVVGGVLELAGEGIVEGFFILWPFVLEDWEWYYQIGGFAQRYKYISICVCTYGVL